MINRILITIIFIETILVIAFSVPLLHNSSKLLNKSDNNIPQVESAETIELVSPNLYPGFKWSEVNKDSPYSIVHNFSDDPVLYLDSEAIHLSLEGKEWNYSDFFKTDEEFSNTDRDFSNFINAEMARLGWKSEVSKEGKKLQVITGGGGGGDIWGYVKLFRDKIRFILIRETYNDKCPCHVSYSVFINDIIPVSDIKE